MATIAAASGERGSPERRFYTGMAVAMALAVLVGFSRSFFLRPLFPAWPSPSEPIIYVHGAVFTAWCILLVAQTSLVNAGRTPQHRRLGVAGAVLAAAMVVLGVYASLVAARRPSGFVGVDAPPLVFLLIPLADMVLFAAFVSLAVLKRRDLQAHKRYMLLGSTSLMTAAVGRWPGVITAPPLVGYLVSDLFLAALVAWDLKARGRLHPVTLWGGMSLVLSQPLRLWLSETPAWLAVARWATGLP
jgi:uncharacterized membrane protein YozB (DUF420 family)